MQSIIIYYSRRGRTAKVARTWAHRIGASRLEIVPQHWRGTPGEVIRYYLNTLTRKPMDIDTYKVDFDRYDRIVLMIPVICGMMSAPMRTFIRQEAGNLQNVEYVIIHKGVKMRHRSLIAWVDRTLGAEHAAASSIWAGWGKEYRPARIDGESVLKV